MIKDKLFTYNFKLIELNLESFMFDAPIIVHSLLYFKVDDDHLWVPGVHMPRYDMKTYTLSKHLASLINSHILCI